MQNTMPRELCELQLPSGPIVGLYQEDSRFYTKQELPHGETFVVEISDPAAAYEYYLFAAGAGECLSPFPEPVPVLPEPEPEPPSLPAPAEARSIRLRARLSQRRLAEILGTHQSTIGNWERNGVSWCTFRGRGKATLARYIEALDRLKRGLPLEGASLQATDGKRRCSHAGCGALLSRFNDGDRCVCHE